MQQVSERWWTKVRESHTVVSYASVLDMVGEAVVEPLQVISGSVTMSAEDAYRRRASLELADPDGRITQLGTDSRVNAYGSAIRIWSGVVHDDGSEEVVTVATLIVTDIEIVENRRGRYVSVRAEDLASLIQGSLPEEVVWPDGFPLVGAITLLILARNPMAKVDLGDPGYNLRGARTIRGDVWDESRAMALENGGLDLSFNEFGKCVLQDITLANYQRIESFPDGDPTNPFEEIRSGQSRRKKYNGAIVRSDAGIYAERWDEDSRSPTYRYGTFGQQPFQVTREGLTQAQCDWSATWMLHRLLHSKPEYVSLRMLPNPALTIHDPIRVHRPSIGVDGVYTIRTMDLPLDGKLMDVTAERVL